MGRDIVDIVMEKSFVELNDAERAELSEFCATEEEFMQLKHVFASVESMNFEQEEPRAEIKEKLDHLFEKTYPAAAPIWYNSFFAVLIPRDKPLHRQPMLHIAALLVLIFLAVPMMQQEPTNDNELLADASTENVTSEQDGANGSGNQQSVTSSDVNSEEVETKNSDVLTTTSALVGSLADERDTEGRTRSLSLIASAGMAPGSEHPDGIFSGAEDESIVSLSVSAQETSRVLDLLTATF